MPRVRRGDVTWVEPRLVAEVEFSEWTHDGHVRQPSYKGLRDDKPVAAVQHERPDRRRVAQGHARAPAVQPRQALLARGGDHQGRPGRLLPCGGAGARPAPARPAVHDAPLPRRRLRQGVLPEGRALAHARVDRDVSHGRLDPRRATTREVDVPLVNDELALLWMVNMGCIDMNPWYSRVDRPERPDFVLFDLDPTPEVPWPQTVEVALILKGLLDGLGPRLVPEDLGRQGLPRARPARAALDLRRHARASPSTSPARSRPATRSSPPPPGRSRSGRGVLIDANQNGMGKTIASVYSVRPHPGAPVSTPLRWEEVNDEARPGRVHDGRRARPRREARRPVRGGADDPAVAREGAARAPLGRAWPVLPSGDRG